jgi:[ribosomal protein S5]-alanine N-acetyltransferase
MVRDQLVPTVRWIDRLPEIETERLRVRIIREGEVAKLVRFRLRNRDRFQLWEVTRGADFFRESAQIALPAKERRAARNGESFSFRVMLKNDDREFIGNVSLRNVLPFPVHAATLGYALDGEYEGKGVMGEAVRAVIDFGFQRLNLRRIEACCMPANVRSAALLERVGFEREGLLRSSYFVNERWEDHLIWSRINENWTAVPVKL